MVKCNSFNNRGNPPETKVGEKEMKRHCGSSENLGEKV
jgi:hypothetical protein